MGILTREITSLDALFVHTLRDVYYAEQKILKSLPKMLEKAGHPQLRANFERHLEQTREHVLRLEQVFALHGVAVKAITCPAIDGIIKEADDVVGEASAPAIRDAALVAAAQTVEHYEMSRYGTLVAWARELGRPDCAALLEATLDEERAEERRLSALARTRLNPEAERAV